MRVWMRLMRDCAGWLPAVAGCLTGAALLTLAGCSGGKASSAGAATKLSISLGSSSVVVAQDGTPATVPVYIMGPAGTATVTVSGLPAGVSEQFTPVGSGPSGTLTLTGGATVAAGSYSPTLTVSLGGQSQTQGFTVVSAVVVKVANTVDTTEGVKGALQQFMSTSFQITEYVGNFFGTGATQTTNEATLSALQPQHVRLQALSQAIPMKSDTGGASDWDFTLLDQTVQPVLASADHSPEFEIAVAPAWMCDASGHLDMTNHLKDFAAYAANLVAYYNTGGFNWGGKHFQSASSQHIQWWGIYNEFNLNGMTAAQYVTLYDTVAPAMLAVDPTIKLSALELSDYGLGTGEMGDPQLYLPTFLAAPKSGGVSAQVDSISTHLYGGCNQTDSDAALFAAVPQFAQNVQYFEQQLQTRADLAHVPVWVTENNVNADFAAANGKSNCNPTQVFVTDGRGSSAFFAAWRPYVFSVLGKAGNQALYQWMFPGDAQYGEVDGNGNPRLSYWVDRALATSFPMTPGKAAPQILKLTATDNASIEALATQNADGTVMVMVVDRAVHAAGDDNGSGDPRTVVVDLSSFSQFYAASLTSVTAGTNLSTGPTGAGMTPAARMTVTLPGYGVAFLRLTP